MPRSQENNKPNSEVSRKKEITKIREEIKKIGIKEHYKEPMKQRFGSLK
jgi:hypothetical protein